MVVIAVQCGRQVFERRLGLLLTEYIFLGGVIVLLTRVERCCFEKMMRRTRMRDCVVVVKPRMQRKDKMLLEVSLRLQSNVVSICYTNKKILLTTPCFLVSNVSSPDNDIIVTESFDKGRVCESRSKSKTRKGC